ncbi:class I SAM-dependent methyltransferase [Amnibacterium kyonggiense]|uniref:Methyltransferase family protein n=1 Tax=Amnibacterium kyonggiense TaxID=595671 RepID=A0A4R7FF05_9MICO|nr:class I SAM-dependent methyltransferase [Amnibacterium kyonggiense]TDS75953.1 methyltransferase family protein [Amnibacterium kyonggiense]
MSDTAAATPALSDVTAAYDEAADRYIELVGSVERVGEEDRAAIGAWAADLTGPVLDVGSGPGHWSGYLHDRGIEVEGVDATPRLLAHARRTHPGIVFRLGDLRELEPEHRSLGGVLAWFSLIHTDPALVPDVLRRLAQGLRPGGSMLVGFFAGDRIEPFDHRVITGWTWPMATMTGALEAVGLAVLDARTWRTPNGRCNAAVRARRVD